MKLKELIEGTAINSTDDFDRIHQWAKAAYAALSIAQHAPIQFAAVAEALEAAEEEL
jgi:hypothetical protein